MTTEALSHEAFTAAREWEPTRTTGETLNAGRYSLGAMGDHRYTTFAGGFPITRNDVVIGGIGVSAIYDNHSDEWFANIGLEAIGATSPWSPRYKKECGLEKGLVGSIFKPCAEYLVAEARLTANERILDVGCGSGIVARVALQANGFDFEAEGRGSEGQSVHMCRIGLIRNPEHG